VFLTLNTPSELVGENPALVEEILSTPRDVSRVPHAAELFREYFAARFSQAVDPLKHQVVLLSGGIDSIVTLAALLHHCESDRVTAITVGGSEPGTDESVARAVASHLGVRHIVALLDPQDVERLSRWAVNRLGVDEMWEVAAAIVLRTALDAAAFYNPVQVWSGDGGDEILAGGHWPNQEPRDGLLEAHGVAGASPTEWLAEFQRKTWSKEWTSRRLVPDFFERVAPGVELYRAMNTEEACRIGARLQASAVWGPSDKEPLRELAVLLGVPPQLTRSEKSPMQAPSELLASLVQAARRDVARMPHAATYRDPLLEPLEYNFVRLWLHTLAAHDES
jgi:asparagine synthetase B (glutamine-hydrolysing)